MAEKNAEKESINGFLLDSYFPNLSGYARWTFAEKDGKQWFIKEFTEPVWPLDPAFFEPEQLRRIQEGCKDFFRQKRKLYDAVNACNTGNIVTIQDFFRWDAHYYVVTEKIPSSGLELKDAASMEADKRLLLLKVLAYNLRKLHEQGIVYADLCPDNILLKRTAAGTITPKLIDFDGCFFEKSPPVNGGLPIREKYISPEVADIFFEIGRMDHKLTKKLDVFSLGLLFHLCWVGELPDFNEKYPFPCVAVLEGETLEVSAAIPPALRGMIKHMLSREPADRPDMGEVAEILLGSSDDNVEKQGNPTVKPSGFWKVPTDL